MNVVRTITTKLAMIGIMAWVLGLAGFSQTSQAAILLVGNEDNANQVKAERALIKELKEQIVPVEKSKRPKVYSYHMNVSAEKKHCVEKLDITQEDLPFVGVVLMENGAPTKVLYRRDRVIKYHRVIEDVLDKANFFRYDASASTVKAFPYFTQDSTEVTDTVVESEQTTAPVASQDKDGRWSVQIGSYKKEAHAEEASEQLRDLGYLVNTDLVHTSNGDFYRVTAGQYSTKTQCLDALKDLRERGYEDAFPVAAP